MRHRSPVRWLAPLALVICAVAVYVVVDQTLLSNEDDTPVVSATSTSTARPTTATTARKGKAAPRTYTVKSGDVLSSIAEKTGVDVEELLRLNPDVEASTLRPGQKLKLR
jgi:LysM repeat protein